MKFSIALAFTDSRQWPQLAQAAEEAGFGGLIVSDHLVYPKKLETPYPYTSSGQPRWTPSTDWPDPLIAIAAMAAVTKRIEFLTSIYVLPMRHPIVAAKQISTAAQYAEGRLILGIGAGWMREEFELVDQPFERRGARLLESVEVMRKLWKGGMVEHHGEFFDFPAVQMAPTLPEPVPIWGGGTSEVALRRAARHFDGWLSEIQTEAEAQAHLSRLTELRAEAGRSELPFGICLVVKDVYDMEGFRRLKARGVSHIVTQPWAVYGVQSDDVETKCEAIRRYGKEMIAQLS